LLPKSDGSPWVIRVSASPHPTFRLFCFPYGGAGALTFRSWKSLVPPAVDLCAIQLPGRETRFSEPLPNDMRSAVVAIADAVRPLLDMPFAFYGHSLGTLFAFEVARELRRRGWPLPRALAVSGRSAPQLKLQRPDTHLLPDAEFVEELRSLEGTRAEVFDHPELLDLMLPVLRSDFRLNETYSCSVDAPFELPILAYGGEDDAEANRDELDAWRSHTTGEFALRLFPGGHFFINTDRDAFVRTLLRDLGEAHAFGT